MLYFFGVNWEVSGRIRRDWVGVFKRGDTRLFRKFFIVGVKGEV